MHSPIENLNRVLDGGIVAVIRAASGEVLGEVCEALLAGGVDCMEITFTVPKAHRVLEAIADRIGDKVLLGAGTVLDPETARTAILAGARFIVAPTVNIDTIRVCKRYTALALPGAFTPTEILSAWEAGADIVKVFPSDFVGPGYLKAVRAPLPQVRLLPTGGVNLKTAAEFLKAGACALGIGSSLVSAEAIERRDFSSIMRLAGEFVRIVRETRAQL